MDQALPDTEIKTAAEMLKELKLASQTRRPAIFDDALVGKFGAGIQWPSKASPHSHLLTICKPSSDQLLSLEETGFDDASDEQSSASDGALDADQIFEREVAETFLRCVHQKFSEENVVLELNGLKLAEERTFVECASYIFTTLLQMCMPPPPHISSVYHALFSTTHYELSKASDQKQFLATFKKLLTQWSSVLQRFLKDEDDQVELMFAFEEFFKGEGVFNSTSHWGSSLAPLISNICQLLYTDDIVTEDAFLSWADEKARATEVEDTIFYKRAQKFIDWLKEAEETDSD